MPGAIKAYVRSVDRVNRVLGRVVQYLLFVMMAILLWSSISKTFFLLQLAMDSSHYYRQWWYWGGEASLRVHGTKMELTSIPDDEWQQVEDAAKVFWDEIAAESEIKAKVVDIFKQYNDDMAKAGRPYRYT